MSAPRKKAASAKTAKPAGIDFADPSVALPDASKPARLYGALWAGGATWRPEVFARFDNARKAALAYWLVAKKYPLPACLVPDEVENITKDRREIEAWFEVRGYDMAAPVETCGIAQFLHREWKDPAKKKEDFDRAESGFALVTESELGRIQPLLEGADSWESGGVAADEARRVLRGLLSCSRMGMGECGPSDAVGSGAKPRAGGGGRKVCDLLDHALTILGGRRFDPPAGNKGVLLRAAGMIAEARQIMGPLVEHASRKLGTPGFRAYKQAPKRLYPEVGDFSSTDTTPLVQCGGVPN